MNRAALVDSQDAGGVGHALAVFGIVRGRLVRNLAIAAAVNPRRKRAYAESVLSAPPGEPSAVV